jgi:hypothetical protein
MKDTNKLVAPKHLTDEQKEAIADALRRGPGRTYTEIAAQFGVGGGAVGRVARQYGIPRKADERRSRVMAAVPKSPNLRDGGILANDEQWRARQQRIN